MANICEAYPGEIFEIMKVIEETSPNGSVTTGAEAYDKICDIVLRYRQQRFNAASTVEREKFPGEFPNVTNALEKRRMAEQRKLRG